MFPGAGRGPVPRKGLDPSLRGERQICVDVCARCHCPRQAKSYPFDCL